MDAIKEILNARNEAIKKIDTIFDELIRKLENNPPSSALPSSKAYEIIYPIATNPTVFKGKSPTAVIFDNERVDVRSWKMVIGEIMQRCNADTEKHVDLMNLRGKISGPKRVLLAKDNDKMRSPIKVDENLYIETHYDTETNLRILMTRILDAVSYDYSNIFVAIRVDTH